MRFLGETCDTMIHTAESDYRRGYICGQPLRLSTRDRLDRPSLPVFICTNPRCGTAIVQQGGAP